MTQHLPASGPALHAGHSPDLDDNPVVVLESELLYNAMGMIKGEGERLVPFNQLDAPLLRVAQQ